MNPLHPPPRLLLGCTLLFWGAMCDRALIGLVAALVVEARHWIRLRWDFHDDACARSWQLATILTAMAGVMLLIDGSRNKALPELLSWLPILMMPVQFVQSYGMRAGIPLGSISYFAKRHRLRAERLGLPIPTGMFHFGNVMFFLCLVASTVGIHANSRLFLPGVLALSAWRILATRQSRAWLLIPILCLAGVGALAGGYGIRKLEERFSFSGKSNEEMFNPGYNQTMIGSVGKVSLSPEIKWRLRPIKGEPPLLLRTATFTAFVVGTSWQAPRTPSSDFIDLQNEVENQETVYRLTRPDPATGLLDAMPTKEVVQLPSFTLRGAVNRGDPLPLPSTAVGVSGIEVDLMELSSFGTTRLTPKEPVMNAKVYWQGRTQPDPPPTDTENMIIPSREQETIRALAKELGLDSDVPASLAKLRSWFHREFTYSLDLRIGPPKRDKNAPGPISLFLTKEKSGHCEYFATAAVLLLREVGIPARYSVGYAAVEKDIRRGEWVIRGTHGHAWCRVWDGTRWIDFDPTPPNWHSTGIPQPGFSQQVADFIQRIREDFFVWRTVPGNQTRIAILMGLIGFGLGSVILVRLWRSRSVMPDPPRYGNPDLPVVKTPLHELEPMLRRRHGARPAGEPFASWVAKVVRERSDPALLDEAITLHQSIRFDPAGAPESSQQRLRTLVQTMKSSLRDA